MSTAPAPPPTHHLTPPSRGTRGAPVLLLLVGSLSPITHMHLRLLELARDTLRACGRHVLGGYISPAADPYPKPHLLSAAHRLRMAHLALEHAPWLAVDPWEASSPRFVRTHEVARRVRDAAVALGCPDVQVFLVCGADLLHAMADEQRWPTASVERLFEVASVIWARRGQFGGEVLEHGGRLERFAARAVEMKGLTWGISSTAVRQSVRKGRSILYMTPKPVVDYILEHGLFLLSDESDDEELDHCGSASLSRSNHCSE